MNGSLSTQPAAPANLRMKRAPVTPSGTGRPRRRQVGSGIVQRDGHDGPEAGSAGLGCPSMSRALAEASSAVSRGGRSASIAENSPGHGRGRAGPCPRPRRNREDSGVASDRTAKVWEWIGAAHDGDGPASLAALCRAAVRWLGVDGASVTVSGGPAARELLFATDELTAQLDELVFTTGEGPGAADFRFGSPMLIPDLEAVAGRWPGFVPAAVRAGARAMFALPLQAGAIRVGVLSLYRSLPGSLTPAELGDVLTFADIALQMVLDAAA